MAKWMIVNSRQAGSIFDASSIGYPGYKLQISAKLCIHGIEMSPSSYGRPILRPKEWKAECLTCLSMTTVSQGWSCLAVWSGSIWVVSTLFGIPFKLQQAALGKHCKLLMMAGRSKVSLSPLPTPLCYYPTFSLRCQEKKSGQPMVLLYLIVIDFHLTLNFFPLSWYSGWIPQNVTCEYILEF